MNLSVDQVYKFRVIQSNNRGFVFQRGDCTYAASRPRKAEEDIDVPTLFIWVKKKHRYLARCWTRWTGQMIEKDYIYVVTQFRDIIYLGCDSRFHMWCSNSIRSYLWTCDMPSLQADDVPCDDHDMVHHPNRNKAKKGLLVRKSRIKAQTPDLSDAELELIKSIYQESKELNLEAGFIKYHVDHIVPLAKGGAHHPQNLRITLAVDNQSKGAKLISGC